MAPRKRYDGDAAGMSDTGNWNVASDYSKLKIMQHLYLADEYELMATFGTSSLLEELNLQSRPDVLKIKALRRLIKALSMIIDNALFAIKNVKTQFGRENKKDPAKATKTDKDLLIEYSEELGRYFEIVPVLFRVKSNSIKKTKEVLIIKEKWDPVLKRIVEIKRLINEPLNRSDLLFLNKEEFDPREFKKQLMERMSNKG